MLIIGIKAPNFSLLSDANQSVSLDNFLGRKVILYFYPKDDTSGCTKQACALRDQWQELKKSNIEVIGVSRDSVKSHQKFKEKYQLPFILLSDENHKVCETYDVWKEKSMYGKKYYGIERSTFLIDDQGKIINLWRKVKVDEHMQTLFSLLQV